MSYRKLHENDILLSFNSVLEEEVQKSYTKKKLYQTAYPQHTPDVCLKTILTCASHIQTECANQKLKIEMFLLQ